MNSLLLSTVRSGGSSTVAPILTTAIAIACGAIAGRKDHGRVVWFVLSRLFSLITLLIVMLLPSRRVESQWETLDTNRAG
jgi:hypothetical protein